MRWLPPLIGLAIVFAGCRAKHQDDDGADDFAEAGADTSAVESDTSVLTSSLVSSAPSGTIGLAALPGGDLGPRDIGDGALAIYLPRKCIKVGHDVATRTVTYAFDGCLGPNGLRNVTGEVHVTYTQNGNQLHLEITADDLKVNKAQVDWAATADVTSTETMRTMVWKATLSGTTAGGRTFARSSDQTVGWTLGEPCFSLSGTSTGSVEKNGDKKEIRTDVSDFRRCRRACPDAGGKIVVTNVTKDKKVEISFDGTDRASAIGPNGGRFAIPLFCQG